MRHILFCFTCLLTACYPRCGEAPVVVEAPPELVPAFVQKEAESIPALSLNEDEAIYVLLKEPSPEELQAMGIALPAGHQAITKAFVEAMEGLAQGKRMKELALELEGLSEAHPWHFLAEPALFSAIVGFYALGQCEEVLKAGILSIQAWPQGTHAAEAWLHMARCQNRLGQGAEFEETLHFIIRRYPQTSAGLKARVELGKRAD